MLDINSLNTPSNSLLENAKMNETELKKIEDIIKPRFENEAYEDILKSKISDLDMDSMDFVDMIFHIEETLDIKIDDDHIDYDLTLNEFINQTIESRVAD